MPETFTRSGIYRRRWQYWYPWGVTRPWKPRAFRGGNEWCDDSLALILPFLGGLCVFWRPGPMRTLPCPEDWAFMSDDDHADYAPCGYYWNGRINEDGHKHWDTGMCEQAREWLDARPVST